jgi:tRNA (mo5U34)-methyltransferase
VTVCEVERRVRELGPWFHALDLEGVRTVENHPLGPFLEELWQQAEPAFPADMRGATVLDIGCNAGFHSLKLHARGARVTAIDHDARYLAQARLAAQVLDADIEFRHLDVYRVEELGRSFDYVLLMGVLYHLRHPLYALDKTGGHRTRRGCRRCSARPGCASTRTRRRRSTTARRRRA